MLFVKFIILILLGFVIISLFTGLYYLVHDKGQTNRTVNALSVRIGLSLLAIVVVIIAGAVGIIEINPNPSSRRTPSTTADPNASNEEQVPAELEADQSLFGSGGRRRIED